MRLLTSYNIDELCVQYDIKMNGIYCRDEIPQHLHHGWYILTWTKLVVTVRIGVVGTLEMAKICILTRLDFLRPKN